jgi:hypothetical protein
MDASIEFQSCRIATAQSSEEACLVLADGVVTALLVRLEGTAESDAGWYLLIGFGPCDREGLVFTTLEAAGAWVRENLATRHDHETSPQSLGAAVATWGRC